MEHYGLRIIYIVCFIAYELKCLNQEAELAPTEENQIFSQSELD